MNGTSVSNGTRLSPISISQRRFGNFPESFGKWKTPTGTSVFPQKSAVLQINDRHLYLIINYDLDITNILVVSPQIRYIEVFDITNPLFNEQIWPVPSDFVKSRFHCT